MPKIVSVKKRAYSVPVVHSAIQFGYSAHSVPYYIPAGVGRQNLYYRTEYRPDNKFSTSYSSTDVDYWIVNLDDGRRFHLAWYLFAPEPKVGDEFEEYMVASMPIWVKIGDSKTYSNVVLGGAALAFAGAVTFLVSFW